LIFGYKDKKEVNAMPFNHIYFDENICDGCGRCVDVCMCDTFEKNPQKGKPPIVRYPEECWFCGCCITHCPHGEKGAIRIVTPFMMRGSFKKSSHIG
jgi:NAD-dependent dihydropyrimidine dehydrogenase PreA subunit